MSIYVDNHNKKWLNMIGEYQIAYIVQFKNTKYLHQNFMILCNDILFPDVARTCRTFIFFTKYRESHGQELTFLLTRTIIDVSSSYVWEYSEHR